MVSSLLEIPSDQSTFEFTKSAAIYSLNAYISNIGMQFRLNPSSQYYSVSHQNAQSILLEGVDPAVPRMDGRELHQSEQL
jgi:hypothetical protein